MTREENIFLAKRNIVDSIWKSANLEGISVTFPEIQAIYDGVNVAHLRIDEIQTINNLKHAWQFLLNSIDNEIDFNYISSVNSLVGSNIIDDAGSLRKYDVSMGGTTWKPELPDIKKINSLIEEYKSNDKKDVFSIIEFMCKLMKIQAFNDGNKRTSMLIANHELIKNGKGIISISNDNKIEFGEKLIKYYENEENLEKLRDFLINNCIEGR